MKGDFLKFLKYIKRYSEHTLCSYENDLNQLLAYLKETYELDDPSQVSRDHLRGWVLNLREHKMSPRTTNRKIATIKSFYKFLLKHEYINSNPAEHLKNLKMAKRVPNTIKEKSLTKLLDTIDFPQGFEGKRDKLIIELLYGLGIRISELISIKEYDVNLFRNNIKIIGKRRKIRQIPIPNPLAHLISNYIESMNREGLRKNDFLMVTDKGEKLYPMFVHRKVRQYLGMVTTLDKRSPHVLRHAYATHLLYRGADINAVKDLLGHSSLSATQIYTNHSIKKLKAAFEQAHPKA